MAIFYPNNPLYYNNSYGEKLIFEALHKLNNDYIIYYSTMWHNKNYYGDVKWGEADFTIFNKSKGILVVEVKSGNISYRNKEWYQKRLDTGEEHIIQNPFAQADRSKYRFIDLIKKNINFNEKCYVEKIVWFPSIENLDNIYNLPLEYSKDTILTGEALLEPEKYLNKAYEYYNMEKNYHLSEVSFERIKEAFAPEFNLISAPINTKNEINHAFLRLTNEQLKLIDYIEEQKFATIQGAAGTGKTLIALEMAKRLAFKGEKVLFLCFNKFLYEKLKNNYTIKNLDILNIHSYLVQFNTNISTRKDMTDILNKIPINDFEYDSLIIDEGQDFPDEVMEKFYDFSHYISGKFLIFYDKNQIIYKNKIPNWILNSECKLLLTKNCRNTYQIAKTSNNILNLQIVQNNNNIRGEMPTLYLYNNENFINKLEYIINDLRKDGFSLSDITILTLKTENNSELDNYKKINQYYVNNNINQIGLNDILFTTSRKFKGLESDAVIIVDMNPEVFHDEIEKNNFYVAASRAKQKLSIMINENMIDAIAYKISDVQLSNNLGKISTKLKVKPIK